MKKLLFAIVAITSLMAMSCQKDEDTTNKDSETSIKGRWEAPRFAETPEDIAFVAIFGEKDLDMYIIAWGQHLKGTYTWTDNKVKFNIVEAKQAYTDVTYDDEGNMNGWSWEAGNLDASTLELTSGYEWYSMTEEDQARAKEDFGEFDFKVNGTKATSTLVGIENITFNKVN